MNIYEPAAKIADECADKCETISGILVARSIARQIRARTTNPPMPDAGTAPSLARQEEFGGNVPNAAGESPAPDPEIATDGRYSNPSGTTPLPGAEGDTDRALSADDMHAWLKYEPHPHRTHKDGLSAPVTPLGIIYRILGRLFISDAYARGLLDQLRHMIYEPASCHVCGVKWSPNTPLYFGRSDSLEKIFVCCEHLTCAPIYAEEI